MSRLHRSRGRWQKKKWKICIGMSTMATDQSEHGVRIRRHFLFFFQMKFEYFNVLQLNFKKCSGTRWTRGRRRSWTRSRKMCKWTGHVVSSSLACSVWGCGFHLKRFQEFQVIQFQFFEKLKQKKEKIQATPTSTKTPRATVQGNCTVDSRPSLKLNFPSQNFTLFRLFYL